MVKITVVICSYGREDFLRNTLDILFSTEVCSLTHLQIERVLVIDQLNETWVNDYPKNWRVDRIHQKNFGGSGGFTRGMIEALDAEADWIVLMDDDATPDPASFQVLADYVTKQSHKRFALHGAMFSSEAPDTIYEAGAFIEKPENNRFGIKPRLAGYKPSEPVRLDPLLAQDITVDYGAWWFFAIHSSTLKEVGLPLPLFIRGDDREYGLRLKRAGIPTLAVAGLRIWHPPHDERPDRWQMLFDWRNTFVTKALYLDGNAGRFGLPWRFFWRTYRMIIGGVYETAELMIAGLEEYLKGPEACVSSQDTILRRARAIDGKHSETISLAASEVIWLRPIGSWAKTRFFLQMLLMNGLLFPAKGQPSCKVLQSLRPGDLDWRLTFRLKRFAIVFNSSQSLKIYTRSRKCAFALLLRLAIASTRYVYGYSRLAKNWKVKATVFSTTVFWRNYLGLGSNSGN